MYTEVSLRELSAFMCWRRGQMPRAQNDGAARPKTDFEAWDLLDVEEKTEWVSEDQFSVLGGETEWAPLLAHPCVANRR